LIVDAGGGTIDISSYKILSNGPLQVEELYETKCESDLLQPQIFPSNSIHFSLASRWRDRYSKGESDDRRYVLLLTSWADCLVRDQKG